jgi:hypothetical protein
VPIAINDTFYLSNNETLNLSQLSGISAGGSGDLLSNDSDADGDKLYLYCFI